MGFKKNLLFLFFPFAIFSYQPDYSMLDQTDTPMVAYQNMILAQVNGKTISVHDLVKKMDVLLLEHYPEYADSPQAKQQFYRVSWKNILDDMVNTQLILEDAKEKQLILTDGEIREEMDKRFGPNIALNLEKIGMNHSEAWNMVKEEMIVQRMNWFYVHSKALSVVTPEKVRKAYTKYCKENPPKETWHYCWSTFYGAQENVEKIHQELCSQENPLEYLKEHRKSFEEKYDLTIQLSQQVTIENQKLSPKHRMIIETLNPQQCSSVTPLKQGYRLFFLLDHKKEDQPSFQEMYNSLKNHLLLEESKKFSAEYVEKLRKHYNFEEEFSKDRLAPFF